jgi:hypothetical protein
MLDKDEGAGLIWINPDTVKSREPAISPRLVRREDEV